MAPRYSRNFFVFSTIIWCPLFYVAVDLVWKYILRLKPLDRGLFIRCSVTIINLAYLPCVYSYDVIQLWPI